MPRRSLLSLRGAVCGCDDLAIFEQPERFDKLLIPKVKKRAVPIGAALF
ncbi:hypothetical protein SAMN06269301_0316 [Geobacter sp. DSM 9736]|nr:hypothetical protein SAMN06269301_0316 [Geobacter sp. DSM 9736]